MELWTPLVIVFDQIIFLASSIYEIIFIYSIVILFFFILNVKGCMYGTMVPSYH